MDIYVGNLPYKIDEQDIADAFGAYGTVDQVKIITDRDTGRSKGFCFVTMNNAEEAQAAVQQMDGSEIGGRPVRVNEARPREDRGGGGGRGGRY